MTVSTSLLLRELGKLPREKQTEVAEKLRAFFGFD